MTSQTVSIGSLPYAGGMASTLHICKSKTRSITADDLQKAFWIFVIGSVFGFVVETIWCLVRNGAIESRSSMVIGPFNAVYCIGALLLYTGVKCISGKRKVLYIFVFAVIAGTAVEFICSLFQEKLFGSVSWDYSGVFLNIGGRVCLLYSIFWGLLGVAWFIAVQPLFEKNISKIPAKIYKPLTFWLAVFMVVVCIVSIAAVARWGTRIDGIASNNIFATILDKVFPNQYMELRYPNMIW